jgi:Tol biopolymer transport system component
MTTLAHSQAHQFLLAAADGLLASSEQELLTEHLQTCAECQGYQAELEALEMQIQAACHEHRETAPGLQRRMAPILRTQHRRNTMNARLSASLKFAIGSVLLAGLVILVVTSMLNVKKIPGTPTPQPAQQTPIAEVPVQSGDRFIAFASTQDGNSEIYVMQTDGSNMLNLTNNLAYDGNPLWSPDGTRLAFESDRDGNRNIYIMNIDGSGLQQLTHDSGNDVLGNWSPDGSHLSFFNDHQGYWLLYTLKTDGSAITQITDTPTERESYFWSPDGKQIAYYVGGDINNRNKIEVINADGTQRHQVATRDPAQGNTVWQLARIVTWSKDGQFLYFEYETGDGNWFVLKVATDDSNSPQKVASGYALSGGTFINGWLGADSSFYNIRQARGASYEYTWQNMQSGKSKSWDPFTICEIPTNNFTGEPPTSAWAASREGSISLLEISCTNKGFSRLYRLDLNTTTLTQIAEFPSVWDEIKLNWSTDDQRALVQAHNKSTSNWEVYTLQTTDPTSITILSDIVLDNQSSNLQLQPFPYSSPNPQTPNQGTPTTAILTSTPLWTSKSSDLIAFTSNANGNANLYLSNSDGSKITSLTNRSTDSSDPVWSPDGNWIAFSSNLNGKYSLHIMRPDGSGEKELTDTWANFAWSPDSQKIAYLARLPDNPVDFYSPAKITIKVIGLDGNILQDTAVGSFNQLGQFGWSQDGSSILYVASQMVQTPTGEMETKESNLYTLKLGAESAEPLIKSGKIIDAWTEVEHKVIYVVRDINEWDLFQNNGLAQKKIATWKFIEIQCSTNAGQPGHFTWNYGAESATKNWSPNGKYLTFQLTCDDGNTWLYLGGMDGKFVRLFDHPILKNSFGQGAINWSPDSKNIIFAADLDATGNLDLYRLNVEAALKDPSIHPLRLTSSGFMEYGPAWQPKP